MQSRITVQKITNDEIAMRKALGLREEVFVEEQKVDREEEFDEFEEESRHFVALDESGEAVGVARWRHTNSGIKLERFAVRHDWRGKGVGTVLVGSVLEDIERTVKSTARLYLHAQLDAVPLYSKFGFHKKGEQFLECDIWHYEMEREAFSDDR
ncbi:MAG: GNAT family N-acetyltransferase [Bacteroidota bacterium]